jgi:4'-phosphopantetheinyl transferase
MIGRYLSCAAESVAFVNGPHGKPSLASDTSLLFNVAHSNRVGLFAFARGTSIGIDVEYVRPVNHDVLAARYFSPVECAALERVPPDRRGEAFFRCWTRKEAYIKALGGGLSVPLDRFEVSVAVESGRMIILDRERPDASGSWTLQDVDVGDDYCAAVAVGTGVTCVTVREVPLKIP